jgi:hypothetical protein
MTQEEIVYDEVDGELAKREKDVPRPLPEADPGDTRIRSAALRDGDPEPEPPEDAQAENLTA